MKARSFNAVAAMRDLMALSNDVEELLKKRFEVAQQESADATNAIGHKERIMELGRSGVVYPQIVRRSLYLSLYGFVEANAMSFLKTSVVQKVDVDIDLCKGTGLKKIRQYLKKFVKVDVPAPILDDCGELDALTKLRHAMIHSNGWIDSSRQQSVVEYLSRTAVYDGLIDFEQQPDKNQGISGPRDTFARLNNGFVPHVANRFGAMLDDMYYKLDQAKYGPRDGLHIFVY